MEGSEKNSSRKCAIILPTYNEKESISFLIDEILVITKEATIIVIDDGSPDGTAKIVRDLAGQNQRILLIERKGKFGIGSALIEGFNQAFKLESPLILTMDADFSHPPSKIPELIEAMAEASLAIGSRYVAGGVIINWPLQRRIVSWGANTLCRLLLNVPSRDNTSNFRCYSAEVLKNIDFSRIRAQGYAFLLELIYRFSQEDRSFKEIPIEFQNRTEGATKLNLKEIMIVAWTFIRLFFLRLIGH